MSIYLDILNSRDSITMPWAIIVRYGYFLGECTDEHVTDTSRLTSGRLKYVLQ